MHSVFRLMPLFAVLAAAGCASDGGLENPFASEADQPAVSTATVTADPYYFDEFPDVPIPRDMTESSGDTFVTVSQGTKTGTQTFSCRVEVATLMNTMRKDMAEQGWALRSLLRTSNDSVLVFEKSDRIATLVFSDGTIYTDMRIFVSSRMDGDPGQSAAPAAAPKPGSVQKLSQ